MEGLPTVLVVDGDAGQAVAAARSLGGAGFRVVAGRGTRAGASRHTAVTVELPPPYGPPEPMREALASVVAAHDVRLLVPCTDAAVYLVWGPGSHHGDIPIIGGDARSVALGSDKGGTLAAADRAGFPTPAWHAPADVAEAEQAALAVGLPCVVKPRRSLRVTDAGYVQRRHRVASTVEEVRSAVDELSEPDGTPPLVQAYVPGRRLAVSAVIDDGEAVAHASMERLSQWPIGGGTGVRRRTVGPDAPGVRAALELLCAVGWQGFGQVEYELGSDGTPRLMEINVRLNASMALLTAAGADLPLAGALVALGRPAPPASPYVVGHEQSWLVGEIHRISDAIRGRGLPPDMRRRDALRESWPPWRPGMHFDELSLRDPRPFLPRRLRR